MKKLMKIRLKSRMILLMNLKIQRLMSKLKMKKV